MRHWRLSRQAWLLVRGPAFFILLRCRIKPYDAKTYAVKGHPFGLTLSEDRRKALIAFFKTL